MPPVDILAADQVQLSLEIAQSKHGAITLPIIGRAATKGSTRMVPHARTGKLITIADNDAALARWTEDVQWVAKANRVPLRRKPAGIGIRVWFLFERPASVSVAERPFMTVTPDVDKMLRAALDALTGIAYEDDSQVVDVHAVKRYSARTETILQLWEEQP